MIRKQLIFFHGISQGTVFFKRILEETLLFYEWQIETVSFGHCVMSVTPYVRGQISRPFLEKLCLKDNLPILSQNLAENTLSVKPC